jgi:hypothetical protein
MHTSSRAQVFGHYHDDIHYGHYHRSLAEFFNAHTDKMLAGEAKIA